MEMLMLIKDRNFDATGNLDPIYDRLSMDADLVAYVHGNGVFSSRDDLAVVLKNRNGEAPNYPVPVSCLLDLLLLGQVPEGVRRVADALQPAARASLWRLQSLREFLRTRSATGAAPAYGGQGQSQGSDPGGFQGSPSSGGAPSCCIPGPTDREERPGASGNGSTSAHGGKPEVAA